MFLSVFFFLRTEENKRTISWKNGYDKWIDSTHKNIIINVNGPYTHETVFNLTQNKRIHFKITLRYTFLSIRFTKTYTFEYIFCWLTRFLWKCKIYTPVEGNLEIRKEITYAFIFDPWISFLRIFLKNGNIMVDTEKKAKLLCLLLFYFVLFFNLFLL